MDLKSLKAIRLDMLAGDIPGVMGLMAMNNGTLTVLDAEGNARDVIMNMDTLKMITSAFELVYDEHSRPILNSPEGHEDLFRKIGEFYYENYPALFGLEAVEELRKIREGH